MVGSWAPLLVAGGALVACSSDGEKPEPASSSDAGDAGAVTATDAPVNPPSEPDALADAGEAAAIDSATSDARVDAPPPDPCAGGPALPDANGPMKIVLFGEGFGKIPFPIDGVYDLPGDAPDICNASDSDAGGPAFSVARKNASDVSIRARFANAPSNIDLYPPVRDDYTERDYMVFELETLARIDGQLVNLKFGAGGGGDTGLYAGSRIEGEVGADLEETGRLDAHFRIWQAVYPTPSAEGGVTMSVTSELLCLWIVGNCNEPIE
jgi:hypothetical protein